MTVAAKWARLNRRAKTNTVIFGVFGLVLAGCIGVGTVAERSDGQPDSTVPVATVPTSDMPTGTSSPTPSPTPAAVTSHAAVNIRPATPQRPRPAPTRPRTAPTRPRPAPTTHAPSRQGVHPGAFCAPAGATGRTVDGVLMRCTSTAADPYHRWRRA